MRGVGRSLRSGAALVRGPNRFPAAVALAIGALVVALAAVAVGAMSGVANAETPPHWYAEGQLVGSEAMFVKAKNNELGFYPANEFGNEWWECRVKDNETISNPAGGGAGVGETRALRVSNCSAPREPWLCGSVKFEVIPRGLPWHGHLARETPNQVSDVIEGVAIELRCKKKPRGVFSGTLHVVVENSELVFGLENNVLSNGSERMNILGSEALKGPHGLKRIAAQ